MGLFLISPILAMMAYKQFVPLPPLEQVNLFLLFIGDLIKEPPSRPTTGGQAGSSSAEAELIALVRDSILHSH